MSRRRKPDKVEIRKLDDKALRKHVERMRLEQEAAALNAETRILESWFDDDYGFGGSDAFERLRDRDGTRWVPLSVPSDRRAGANWPLWRTETELAELRQKSRMVCAANSYGRCLLRNTVNFIVGQGFKYKASANEKLDTDPETPGEQLAGDVETVVDQTADFMDQFLRLNRWNAASIDPLVSLDTGAHVGPREREAVRRTKRDGDCFIRFFFQDDGTTIIRWIEPEQIRNPPGGTEQNGWSYGIKHFIDQETGAHDVERIVAYYVVYKEIRTKGTMQGEEVPANEIVHLKNLDDDATTKRGVPEFAWDVYDALQRASKLQRHISIGAAIRAATAETWRHTTGTQSQITSLAAGLKERTVIDPVTGNQETQERVRPGMIRRIPQGQEPVPLPTNTGTPEHLEAVQGDLRQASAGVCAPEYMTGDASNANFASTKEAGTPYVRATEADQAHFMGAFVLVIWKALRWAVECGKLPAQALKWVVVEAEAPPAATRDQLQQAQTDQIYVGLKAKSPQRVGMELGLDPDKTQQDFDEHQEANGASLQLPAGFGQDGEPTPTPKPGTALVPTEKKPAMESLLESLNERDELLKRALEALERPHVPAQAPPAPQNITINSVNGTDLKSLAESLVSGITQAMPQPQAPIIQNVVNVSPTPVTIEPAEITVEAPTVNIAAPQVNVTNEAPKPVATRTELLYDGERVVGKIETPERGK